jgi:hypothetical protein
MRTNNSTIPPQRKVHRIRGVRFAYNHSRLCSILHMFHVPFQWFSKTLLHKHVRFERVRRLYTDSPILGKILLNGSPTLLCKQCFRHCQYLTQATCSHAYIFCSFLFIGTIKHIQDSWDHSYLEAFFLLNSCSTYLLPRTLQSLQNCNVSWFL